MSGGHFDYKNDYVANEIFGWETDVGYGLGEGAWYTKAVKSARRVNPFEDKLISELVFDMFCLIHSYDWYRSGDTGEEQYIKDKNFFKNKWLSASSEETVERQISQSVESLIENLRKELIWENKKEEAS